MSMLLAAASLLALASPASAAPEHRAAAAALVRELEAASNARDATLLLARTAPDIVMVSKNGEIVVGREAVAAYVDRMIGAGASLKEMRSQVRMVGEPLALGADFAVVCGTSDDRYVLASGVAFEITTLWSAALVRQAGDWRVAVIHYSFNLFDNPLLAAARGAVYWSAAIGLLLGLACGFALHWLQRKLTHEGRRK